MTKEEFIQQFCIANGATYFELLKLYPEDTKDTAQRFATAAIILANKLYAQSDNDKNKDDERDERPILDKDLRDCILSTRAYNALRALGVETVRDITNLSRNDIRALLNEGSKTLVEIEEFLEEYHLELKKH